MRRQDLRSGTLGASLAGLLVVIVVLGVLAAAAIAGVSTLSDKGSPVLVANGSGRVSGSGAGGGSSSQAPGPAAGSSCNASADAARSASTLYYANRGGQSYPVNWTDLTTSNPPVYMLATDVVINPGNPGQLDGIGWKLIISGGGASPPSFTCSTTVRR